MKPIFTGLFLTLQLFLFAQNSNKDLYEKYRQLNQASDSHDLRLEKHYDSLNRVNEMNRQQTNLSAFYSEFRERENKARQRMWWRIGIGVALLALGIFGFSRKRK